MQGEFHRILFTVKNEKPKKPCAADTENSNKNPVNQKAYQQ